MDKEIIQDTLKEPTKEPEKKKPKEKPMRESIEQFLYRKEKEESRKVSPSLKRMFIVILAKNKNDLEKSWSELWA